VVAVTERYEVDAVTYVEPGEAARRLGVSPSGLRRVASAYEEVHGPLNRRGGTGARLFTVEALERLAQARALVENGRYKSTVEALTGLEKGLEPETPIEMTGHRPAALEAGTGEALAVLIAELRAVRDEVARLRAVVEDRNGSALPPGENVPLPEHGPLVRFALWLERRFRG
jgi:DNA-binding transcriptional MerR regulator